MITGATSSKVKQYLKEGTLYRIHSSKAETFQNHQSIKYKISFNIDKIKEINAVFAKQYGVKDIMKDNDNSNNDTITAWIDKNTKEIFYMNIVSLQDGGVDEGGRTITTNISTKELSSSDIKKPTN